MAIQRIVDMEGVKPSTQRGSGKGMQIAVADRPPVVQIQVPEVAR
jgi:hypothetical protein